jgi:CheY-like chemotaxis protein
MTNRQVFEGEILLCEDNSMNQELICERLKKLGLKTSTAENGKEGVEKVEYRMQNGIKPFDLIFMDIFMPVMDGLEAAIEIGKLNTGSPIIALTANSTSADREQYTAHGMSDCLNKPFTPQELLDCLKKYIAPDHPDTQVSDLWSEEKLKAKLVHTFIRNNKNLYNKIAKAIEDGDIKLAHRLAHTLKSNAGLLNKIHLQKAAENAENLLANEDNRINRSAMNVLKTELEAVLEEFAPLAAKDSKVETKHVVAANVPDDRNIKVLFEELETLFNGGDLKCLELIDRTSGPNLRSIPGTGELIQQMEYFEFDTAKKTLAQLKEIRK